MRRLRPDTNGKQFAFYCGHKSARVPSGTSGAASEGKRGHAVAGTLSALRRGWLRADGFWRNRFLEQFYGRSRRGMLVSEQASAYGGFGLTQIASNSHSIADTSRLACLAAPVGAYAHPLSS